MFDLFGHTHTTPGTVPPRRILNGAHGFPEWWTAWGSHFRKADKQKCLDRWSKEGYAEAATLIQMHTVYMLSHPEWQKDAGAFRPAPIVYLRREAWNEWTPVAVAERPEIDPALAKLTADSAICKPPPADIAARMKELRRRIG